MAGEENREFPSPPEQKGKEEPWTEGTVSRILNYFLLKFIISLPCAVKFVFLVCSCEDKILILAFFLSHFKHFPVGFSFSLEEETVNSSSPSELEDKVDALTEELVQILEDEQQFLSSEGNEDLLSYYLEITTLEKESLVKQINELEEEIARGREL